VSSGGERQIPLDLGHVAGLSRDDLVLSSANGSAVAFIERWPDWPGPVALLAGPAGSGKSHLAAIWRGQADALSVTRSHIAAEIARHSQPRSYLLEDADLPGLDQQGLFHLINSVSQNRSALLITARSFPAAWGVSLPDLASRMKAATVIEIGEPDDDLLAGVMTKLFADRQVDVEPHVIQFLVRRIERSLGAVNTVVQRLDRAALEQQARITRQLAATVLSAFDRGQDKQLF
jgi:chromosomal replication initiation ATPase DnaA